MWTLSELARDIDETRARILRHRRALSERFVRRDEELDLLTLCAAAQEPLLFVGPPGTAKSDMVVKFVESLGLGEGDYFEYMLTKFTEPGEILGPVDIEALKQGRFVRRTRARLPEARVAFLDEVFKGNSAILNTLLTLVNERKFYQDGAATPARLALLFGATNEVPDAPELDALADRFVLKVETLPVKDTHFTELIDAGARNEVLRATAQRPWVRGDATLDDYLRFKAYLDLSAAAVDPAEDRARWFPAPVIEDRVTVSDRKAVKLYRLIRARAFLHHGGAVRHDDLSLLAYVGNRRHELAPVAQKVRALLSLPGR